MRRMLVYGLIAAAALASGCQAQGLLDHVNVGNGELGGLRLYKASVFSGYSSSAFPLAAGQFLSPGLGAIGPDVNYGANATLGWQKHGDRTNLSIGYSGTYTGMARYTDLNAFGHSFSMNAGRRIARKWSVTASASAQDTTLAQYLYEPATLSAISELPSSFDDLAAAFSVGHFSNDQIASMLTGAPILEAPARSLLLGDRILSYAVQSSVTWARSSRLSFHFGSFAAGGQHRAGGQGILNSAAPQAYLMPRSLGATGGAGMSYALSPRTQVGVDVEEHHLVNRFQSSYGTTATASLGRKMGKRWFLRGYGGGSFTHMLRQSVGTPSTRQVVGGGSLGFRTYAHTFLGSFDRYNVNTYGLGVGVNTSAAGSWRWRRPASRWSVFASFGEQRMRDTGFADLSGWRASAGVAQSLSDHMVLNTEYVYLSNGGSFGGNVYNLAVHSVRVSLGWAPQQRHR